MTRGFIRSVPLLSILIVCASPLCNADDVYIVTSKMSGVWPKIGPIKHASVAICPEGVSPVVCENGVAVSNCTQCRLYGTQLFQRGFQIDKKRVGVTAIKLNNVSSQTVLARIHSHRRLNIPVISDCRHHVMQVTGRNKGRRLIGRLFAPLL